MARKKDGSGVLGGVPLFGEFSKRDLKRLEGLMREEWFSAGQDIVREGETGARFYVIVEGRVKILSGSRARKTLGPGAFFGEMSLIDGAPRTATVRADTQVRALSLSRTAFRNLLEESWPLTQKVLAELCARVRNYEKSYAN